MGKAIILVGFLVAACDSRVEDAVTLASQIAGQEMV